MRRLVVFVFILVFSIFVVPKNANAELYPITQRDIDLINVGQNFRDPITTLSCSPTAGAASVRTLYIIGDSWLTRLENANPSLNTILEEQGYTIAGSNSSVGRSINGGGEKNQSGLAALEQDKDLIAKADMVLVVLGTNADNYDKSIPEFMEKLNSIKSVKVAWVNTAANASDEIAAAAGSANEAIKKYSAQDQYGYQIVDFFTMAFPSDSTADSIDPSATSPLLDSDGIHPKIPEGINILITLIQGALGGPVTASSAEGPSSTGAGLPQVAIDRLSGVEDRVRQNQPAYESSAAKYGIPWQVFGALHYREAGNDPNRSILDGKPLGEKADDSDNRPKTLEESVDIGFEIFVNNAKSFYDVIVGPNMSFTDLQNAFLAYNRGALYKNVPTSEGGPWSADISPYVMNLYDDAHSGPDGQGMEWPRGTSGTIGVKGKWGETVSGTNNPAGTMTFIAYFGLSPAGSSSCGGSTLGSGQLKWPVMNGATAAGRVTACWSDLRHRTVSGGTSYHSGVDIAAAAGTPVQAMQAGTVVFAGSHSDYGNLVIIDHGTGIWSHYGHLRNIESAIKEGVSIAAGTTIGGVGNTGVSTGDHLHLNMYRSWPFGPMPEGAANSNGQETINPFTNGLALPEGVPDEVGCLNWPNGGREDWVAI